MASESGDWNNQLHFVLVHGAGHGAWCWYKLTTLLEAAGHKVTAVDLAGCGIDPTPFTAVKTFAQLNEPLVTLISSLPSPEKVVLVGHSIGGLNITDVLYKFPEKILVAVFIAATMLKKGYGIKLPINHYDKSLLHKDIDIHALLKQLFGALRDILHWEVKWESDGILELPGVIVKPDYQRNTFYNMSSVEDSTLASTLVRPTAVLPLLNVPFEETEDGESVPRVFVRTLKDNLMSQWSQEIMIHKWPPSKVYATGSDHSPFLSTPVELARILIDAATFIAKGN